MSAGQSDRGSTWENQVDGNYGPGQEPSFFIEVSGKKLAVTFDKEKGANGEWKVDTSSIKVAEDASAVIKGVSQTVTNTTATDVYKGSTITTANIDVVGSQPTTTTITAYKASTLIGYGIESPNVTTTTDVYSGTSLISAGVRPVVTTTSQPTSGNKLYDIDALLNNGFSLASGQPTPDSYYDYAVVANYYNPMQVYAVPVTVSYGNITQVGNQYYELTGSRYLLEAVGENAIPHESYMTSGNVNVPYHSSMNTIHSWATYTVVNDNSTLKLQEVSSSTGTPIGTTMNIDPTTYTNIPRSSTQLTDTDVTQSIGYNGADTLYTVRLNGNQLQVQKVSDAGVNVGPPIDVDGSFGSLNPADSSPITITTASGVSGLVATKEYVVRDDDGTLKAQEYISEGNLGSELTLTSGDISKLTADNTYTSSNTVTSSDVPEGKDLAEAISNKFDIALDKDADHSSTKITNDIFLNATEEAIETLMDKGVVSGQAFNFDFYTKVNIQSEGGPATVNVKLDAKNNNSEFVLDLQDIDVAVESFHNVAEDAGAGVTSSSEAGEFVKINNSADIALGNGGDDTYVVGSDSGIYGGVALEYGNIGVRGGLEGSIDAVNFNSVTNVDDLTFTRGKYRNEAEGNTLFIGDGKGQETVLFDNYNEHLDFRRVEYLTVEDGANNDEIFEIVTDKNLADWDNEIYVADGGQTNVKLGGLDYVIGSSKADEFVVDLTDLIGNGKSGTVNLSGIDASDTITVNDGGKLSDADETDLTAALSQSVAGVSGANGEATITFSYDSNTLTLDVDTAVDALNIDNREFDWLV